MPARKRQRRERTHDWQEIQQQALWPEQERYERVSGLDFARLSFLGRENYSRACLASKISATQNQWDYLEVLFAALSAFGAPSTIVSDGGGIFYTNQAMDVYSALGIKKDQ